ncbi:hypothetical protein PR202_ga08237 [Eleusine coracana subsp. coracana]|uniref:Uncharacterized protein n=1 Tax=Eleusine coracana subsp. coracana TaxID=191504 RepID=A0AAV5C013_ELECO|nr:hypothetical protein PR202_ga08237 [Eleusine coracana subsp. coracana]
MDCVIHIVLRVMMRRSICRLQEVVGMAAEIGTALFVAVRVSGLAGRRRRSQLAPPLLRHTTTPRRWPP